MHRVNLERDRILPAPFLPRTIPTAEKRLLHAVLAEAVGTPQRYVPTYGPGVDGVPVRTACARCGASAAPWPGSGVRWCWCLTRIVLVY
jgi:hypothetical protein